MGHPPSVCILALLLIFMLPFTVSANSVEPPGMTIIVEDAPEDLTLTLELAADSQDQVRVQQAKKGWETYFRLYYSPMPDTLEGAVIRVDGGGTSFSCPLPEGVHNRHNNLLTLNFQTQTGIAKIKGTPKNAILNTNIPSYTCSS